MDENEISYTVRKCIFNVYNTLGPGLLESVYQKILVYELEENGLDVNFRIDIKQSYFRIEINENY